MKSRTSELAVGVFVILFPSFKLTYPVYLKVPLIKIALSIPNF